MGLDKLEQNLIRNEILPSLSRLLPTNDRCFLVGGAIRDALLGRCSDDFDFTTANDPTDLAQAFAEDLGGSWFMLDAQRRQSRVVFGQGKARFSCDFSPFRASNLQDDLQRRDFTINAMAMAVEPDASLGPLIDPLGGQLDLQRNRLRCCSPQVLFDDPLRVLKGLRHAIGLQLTIEPGSLAAMRDAAPNLDRVAPERIRNELASMLGVSPARRSFLWLQELKLLELLFGAAAKPRVTGVGLTRLDRAEAWLQFLIQADETGFLGSYFAQELEQGITREVAFKLAAWFSGQRFGDVRFILQKLHCSRAVQRAIDCMLDLEQHQADEFLQLPAIGRSRALWAEGLGSNPPMAICFLGLMFNVPFADAASLSLSLLSDLDRLQDNGQVPDMLSGRWLQQNLSLRGYEVGLCLAALRQEEIAGRIVNRQQAEEFALNHWQKTAEKTIDKET